jgi:hypothetical protein
VNCQEFDERITPAVDQRLQADDVAAFREHAGQCPGCRRAYEAELAVKTFIRQRMHLVRMPGSVTASIIDRLGSTTSAGTPLSFIRETPRSYRYMFAAAAVLFLAYLVSSPFLADHSFSSRMRADVFAQSVVTYAGVLGGQMKPEIESAQPEVLLAFFEGKTAFPVRVHNVRDFTPVGAMMHESAGVPLAQVLYSGEGATVYVYQTCWRTVQDGRKLNLPDHILTTLRKGESYVEENADGQTMVLWTEGRTLCGAVANMHKQHLLAHLDVVPVTDVP